MNDTVKKSERMRCEGIDKAIEIAMHFDKMGIKDLAMGKVDVKSAYRRIPVSPKHRKYAWVAIATDRGIRVSRHNALCFGATGSVYAWNRAGMFLSHVLTALLKIPTARWVDDFFWVEPKSTAEHALSCVERLFKLILGHDAVEESKMEWGNPIEVLGAHCKFMNGSVAVRLDNKKYKNGANFSLKLSAKTKCIQGMQQNGLVD